MLADEVDTSTLTIIEFEPWHEQPLGCILDQNSAPYRGYTDGSRRIAAEFCWTLLKSDGNRREKKIA
jgi:hypothetical protein